MSYGHFKPKCLMGTSTPRRHFGTRQHRTGPSHGMMAAMGSCACVITVPSRHRYIHLLGSPTFVGCRKLYCCPLFSFLPCILKNFPACLVYLMHVFLTRVSVDFYRAAVCSRSFRSRRCLSVRPSVCLSVCHSVNCDKTNESSAEILIPHER